MEKLSFEQKSRLKLNQIAAQSAFERLRIAHNESNQLNFYAASTELLLWIITSHDWHIANGSNDYTKKCKQSIDGCLIYGMRHAFNMLKHNMNFMLLHEKTSNLRPPFKMGSVPRVMYVWVKAGEVLNGKTPTQKENYIKHLEGKDIFLTFKRVMTFLEIESQQYT